MFFKIFKFITLFILVTVVCHFINIYITDRAQNEVMEHQIATCEMMILKDPNWPIPNCNDWVKTMFLVSYTLTHEEFPHVLKSYTQK